MYVSVIPQRRKMPKQAGTPEKGIGRKPAARLIRSLAMIGMMIAAFWLGAQIRANAAADVPAASAGGARQAYLLHAVEPGDTLWTIAGRHLPDDMELGAFIHEIRRFNGMETSRLLAGQVLKIPVRP